MKVEYWNADQMISQEETDDISELLAKYRKSAADTLRNSDGEYCIYALWMEENETCRIIPGGMIIDEETLEEQAENPFHQLFLVTK